MRSTHTKPLWKPDDQKARLAELTEVDAMTMVRILDRMEADGLLERRPDPADRRARCLYLTPKAKPLLDEIWRMSEATRAEVFDGIGKEERDVLIDVLERIHENLCRLEGTPPRVTSPEVEYSS